MKMILGEKIGMTRIFDKNNKNIGITLIKAIPNKVIFIKTKDKDGYNAVQIASENSKLSSKPLQGHLKKSDLKSIKFCGEFRITDNEIDQYKINQLITVENFKIGQKIDITAISKGKGFAGVIKRHGFSGMPASHGHEKQRIPGSIGCCYPQRVIKGKRMAGHMGVNQVTTKSLKIVDIDIENNLIAIKGAVPGSKKTMVKIKSK